MPSYDTSLESGDLCDHFSENHRKINFFRRVTAISVYAVGDVTLLTDARSGALMGASIFFFKLHLMFLYNFAQGRHDKVHFKGNTLCTSTYLGLELP